ncbi:hypothetical protein [Algoriphagus sp. PAP.12]|uniref:hypothetical protein n=1 Tax=Algoriphagus sp. PAP.12 TaxID=2996678 RepID=UPI00227B1491|nr:hypothetical protein [Algoriphagus sp. PAP.12]
MRFLFLIFLFTVGITPLSADELSTEFVFEPCVQENVIEVLQPSSESISALVKIFRATQKNRSSERFQDPLDTFKDLGLTFFQCKISSSYSPVEEIDEFSKRIKTAIKANAP